MEIGSYICVYKTMEVKTIQEKEIINDEMIFYMSDSTSYHENEITDDPKFLREGFLLKMKKQKSTLESTIKGLVFNW